MNKVVVNCIEYVKDIFKNPPFREEHPPPLPTNIIRARPIKVTRPHKLNFTLVNH